MVEETTATPPSCHPDVKWVVATNGKAFCPICGREPNQPQMNTLPTPDVQSVPIPEVSHALPTPPQDAPVRQDQGTSPPADLPKPSTTSARDPLLVARQTTHGNFADNARISQYLKRYFRLWNGVGTGPAFNDIHAEALDMICLKLSRIISGQADFHDHWDDIAGYAKLAAEACTK